MNDPQKYFRLYLLSLPSVAALGSDRVVSIPADKEITFPFVGFYTVSDSDDYEEEPFQDVIATVFCYAKDKSGQASRELFQTLQDAMVDDQVQIAGQVLSGIDISGKAETLLENQEESALSSHSGIVPVIPE